MTEDDRRAVLEGIARDEDAYPRDRIAAVRALEEMLKPKPKAPPEPKPTVEDELDRILVK